MTRPNSAVASSEELFEVFRQGAELSRQIDLADELGSSALSLADGLENLTISAREMAVEETVQVNAIDGNKRPFVSRFLVNELAFLNPTELDTRTIPGHPGRFQANEDYLMTMFPGYYKNVYPIKGRIKGKVVAVDLETSDLIIKRKDLSGAMETLFGSRTWIKLLGPDGKTPLVKVDFLQPKE